MPSHAGSVTLVLNPRTGHISPQFQAIFDNLFTTVAYTKKSEVPPNWTKLVEKSSERVTDEDNDLAKTWLFPDAKSGDIAMQTNQRPSIVPTGTHNAAPNAPSNNTTTVQRSGHQLSHVDFSGSNGVQGISIEDSIHS